MQSMTAKPRLYHHLELHDGICPRLMRMMMVKMLQLNLPAEVNDVLLYGRVGN